VLFCRLNRPGLIPRDQAVQIVAVRPVGAESFLVEEPLDAASEAYLVGVALGPHGPAHPTVPTTSEHHDPGARQACRQQTQGPQPTTLLLLTHFTETGKLLLELRI